MTPTAPDRYCTVTLAGQLYGLPIAPVREVLRSRPLTRVPHAPADVRGLFNLRGQIVPALDLRTRLGLPPVAVSPSVVVVDVGGRTVGLLVDEAGAVVVPPAGLEPLPDAVPGAVRAHARGAYQTPTEVVIVLDIDRLTAASDVHGPAAEGVAS